MNNFYRAHRAVIMAIDAGTLPAASTQTCEINDETCSDRVVWHHDSYDEAAWLQVRALCDRHHALWHARHEAHNRTKMPVVAAERQISVGLLSALGIPDQRTAANVARMLDLDPARLSPSRLDKDRGLTDALRAAVAALQGGPVPDVSLYARARAGALVDALDAGESYSLPELGARMRLWGMPTADEWLIRLHQAGAAEVFAAHGWAGVRRWAREVRR